MYTFLALERGVIEGLRMYAYRHWLVCDEWIEMCQWLRDADDQRLTRTIKLIDRGVYRKTCLALLLL
jgi:hypothetical protein